MEIEEPIYEDMTIKTSGKVHKTIKDIDNLDEVYREYEEIQFIDEEDEDIYEVIPADFSPISWSEKTSRSSSISSQSSARSKNLCVATIGIQTDEDNDSISTTASINESKEIQNNQDDDNTPHYAEILHANDFKVTEIIQTRPTRESDNPILRQDFAQLADNKLSELQTIRNAFTYNGISKQLDSKRIHAEELPAHLLLKRSLSTGDNRNGFVRKFVDVVYENSPRDSPVPNALHNSTPLYENVMFPLDSDRESRCSISSSSTEGKSFYSEEENATNEESLYENVDEYATDEPRVRTKSQPIDIVYSDLEFHGEKEFQESIESNEELDLQSSRKIKSLSAVERRPPSPRGGLGLARPKSLSLRNRSSEALGLCRARFIKKLTVNRSNDKTLQATITDVLSRGSDPEEEPFVNVEVNSELVRISTDYPPWEVIASCDIEAVGYVNLYKSDRNILGIIVSPLGDNSTCYIIRSPQASQILATIKTAFKAPNLSQTNLRPSPDSPSFRALPGDECYTSIPHITYLGYVKVKKSYLVINDSINSLLDQSDPLEFKPITLKIRPEEILIVDESNLNTLHRHSVSWVLSLGVFSDDSRLFGYIVTEARQGEKTRMYCHAFRCGRVTASMTATETIRLACQATFSPGRKNSAKSRRDSQKSIRSSCSSDSSSLERHVSLSDMTEFSSSSSSGERRNSLDNTFKKTSSPGRLLRKLSSKKHSLKSKPAFRSYTSEPNLTSIVPNLSEDRPMTSPSSTECSEIVEEKEYTFTTAYLCSTVINPPLRPKHVRDSVKQYVKELKKMEKQTKTTPIMKEVELCVTSEGVTMLDPQCRDVGQRFFPFPCISNIRTHKEYPEYFAFSTVVTGDAKHKCHIFKQVKEPCDEITTAFESFMWEKV